MIDLEVDDRGVATLAMARPEKHNALSQELIDALHGAAKTIAQSAAATITIAYLRPAIMRFVFGVNYEFQSFKLNNTTKAQQFTFLALLIMIHHMVYFTMEIFSFANILMILQKTLWLHRL